MWIKLISSNDKPGDVMKTYLETKAVDTHSFKIFKRVKNLDTCSFFKFFSSPENSKYGYVLTK